MRTAQLRLWIIVSIIFISTICHAQYSITGDATQTITFTGFEGDGFAPSPTSTQLDSDTWGVDLSNDGTMDSDFGDTNTGTVYANGESTSGYNAGGWPPGSIQAYTYNGVDRFGVRNGYTGYEGDIAVILKIQNNTGGDITSLDIEYDLASYVNGGIAAGIEFYYSSDNSSYTQIAGLGTTFATGTNFTNAATTLSGSISETISDGADYYLKWVWREHGSNSAAIAIIDIDITATIAAGAGEGTLTDGSTNFGDLSSLSNSDPGEDVFDFTITDDASTGSDAFPIQFTDVIFRAGGSDGIDDWSDVIAGARLEDSGGNFVNASSIGTNTITFSSIGITSSDVGYVPDDGSETYTLSVWLSTSITEDIDGDLLHVSLSGADFTFSGATSTITTTESAASNTSYNSISVTATNWGFENTPTSVGLSEDFSLTIAAVDVNGNVDVDDNSSTFIISRGSTGSNNLTEGGGALSAKTLTSGRYTYSNLQYDAAENFDIDADDSGGTFYTSATSTVIAAALSYQSVGSGNWNADFATIWEYWDGSAWQTAASAPDNSVGTIYIRSGTTISVDADFTADQVIVESGGTLNMDQGNDNITIADGPGTDLIVESGGTWGISVGSALPTLTGTAQVQSEGTFICSNTNALDDIAESTQIDWQTDAVLYYTATGEFPYNTDFFPSVVSGTYPILEVDGATGDPGLWSVNGIFKVSSGTFTIDGGNGVTIRDGFAGDGNIILDNAASFSYTGSTLFLSGAGSLDLDTRTLAFSSTTVEMQSDKEVFNGTITLDGNCTVNGSTYSLNDGTNDNLNLTISDGATINSDAASGLGATLAAGGTVTMGSEIDYNFAGSSTQTLNFGSVGVTAAENVTVDNSSGVILNSDLTINNRLTLTNGIFSTSSSSEVLTISSVADIVGASSTNYFDGPVEIQGLSTSYTFHSGDGANYRPVIVTPSSSSDITVEMLYSTPPNNTSVGSGLAAEMAGFYWSIQRGSGTGNVTAQLYYKETTSQVAPDNDQIYSGTHLRLIQYDGSTQWEDLGLDAYDSDLANLSSITGTISSFIGTNDFYTIGAISTSNLLPVEWVSFTGQESNGTSLLKWSTATELNNDRFEVEHSLDGIHFSMIDQVVGHGTVNEMKNYSYQHRNPTFGTNYYRLKQVDFDGQFEYSKIVYVNHDAISNPIRLQSNPIKDQQLRFIYETYGSSEQPSIKLLNLSGQQISVNGMFAEGNVYGINMQGFPTGIYLLHVNDQVTRVILE